MSKLIYMTLYTLIRGCIDNEKKSLYADTHTHINICLYTYANIYYTSYVLYHITYVSYVCIIYVHTYFYMYTYGCVYLGDSLRLSDYLRS